MILQNYPQGSMKWITERLWRLTASQMKKNITSTGKLSESQAALENIDKLIAGIDAANTIRQNPAVLDGMDDWQVQKWLANYTGEKFTGNLHTRRGNDCEPDALAAMAEIIGTQIEDVGMCIMGDNVNGVVSCSPDGLIYSGGKIIAGAEVKAPTLATYFGYLADGVLPEEYKLQVHSSMAICEVDTWHFGAYFTGEPLFYVEVKREKFTDSVRTALDGFRAQYEARYSKVRAALDALSSRKEGVL